MTNTERPKQRRQRTSSCFGFLTRTSRRLWAAGVALCSQREYFLVSTPRTWTNAKMYCRERYVDLATVLDADDVSRLSHLAMTKSRSCWIGLKSTKSSWAWSLGGDSSSLAAFANWDSSPLSGCGAMRADGKWRSFSCSQSLPFVCQSGEHARALVVIPGIAGCRSFKLRFF